MHHYNSTQYCIRESVFLISPVLQTNITSQTWPSGGKKGAGRLPRPQISPCWRRIAYMLQSSHFKARTQQVKHCVSRNPEQLRNRKVLASAKSSWHQTTEPWSKLDGLLCKWKKIKNNLASFQHCLACFTRLNWPAKPDTSRCVRNLCESLQHPDNVDKTVVVSFQ